MKIVFLCGLTFIAQNDGFAELLYDSNWYRLPKWCQLVMIHLINRKQRGVKITVGPFANINRELTTIVSEHRFPLENEIDPV